MIALLLPAAALATQIATHSVPCPLGGGPVTVFEQLAADQGGGYDSDLARYATKGQFRAYAVATCPNNLYSALNEDMIRTFSPELESQIRAALEQLRPQLTSADAEKLPPWERHLIAAELYRLQGRDALFLASLYLEAAWTARDEAVGTYAGLRGPQGARQLLDAGETELTKPLAPNEQKTLRYNLARVAWRGGYSEEARAQLRAFEALGPLDEAEQAAVARFREMTERVEPAYQDRARELLRAAVEGGLGAPADRARAHYLLGDLARRRGDLDEAKSELRLALADKNLPAEQREMADFLLAELSR